LKEVYIVATVGLRTNLISFPVTNENRNQPDNFVLRSRTESIFQSDKAPIARIGRYSSVAVTKLNAYP